MKPKIFFTIGVLILLLGGCGSSDNTASTNTNGLNGANIATSSSPASTPPPINTNKPGGPRYVPTVPPSITTTVSGDMIGVPECDDYLAKYEACLSGKMPESARAQFNSALEQTRKSWRQLAENPQTKASLASACKQATASAKTALKAYNCEF